MNQLFDIYRKAQVNAEGYITDDALVQAFDAAPVDQEKLKLMLKNLDADQNLNIEFAEFVNWASLPEKQVLSKIQASEGVPAIDIMKKGVPLPDVKERNEIIEMSIKYK